MRSLRRPGPFRWALALGLAALVLAGSTQWRHVTGEDDAASQASLVLHDHAAHRLRPHSESSVPEHEHCYICHWMRALGGPASIANHAVDVTTEERVFVANLDALAHTAIVRIPARSPPA